MARQQYLKIAFWQRDTSLKRQIEKVCIVEKLLYLSLPISNPIQYQMPGVSWIEHKSKKILFIDFKGCKAEKDMVGILFIAQEQIKLIEGEYLQLSDVSTVFATPNFMRTLKDVAKQTPRTASKRAIVGVTNHARRILLQAYVMSLGTHSIKPFKDLEEAIEWLVA